MVRSEKNHSDKPITVMAPFQFQHHPNIQFDTELTPEDLKLKVETHIKFNGSSTFSETTNLTSNSSIHSPPMAGELAKEYHSDMSSLNDEQISPSTRSSSNATDQPELKTATSNPFQSTFNLSNGTSKKLTKLRDLLNRLPNIKPENNRNGVKLAEYNEKEAELKRISKIMQSLFIDQETASEKELRITRQRLCYTTVGPGIGGKSPREEAKTSIGLPVAKPFLFAFTSKFTSLFKHSSEYFGSLFKPTGTDRILLKGLELSPSELSPIKYKYYIDNAELWEQKKTFDSREFRSQEKRKHKEYQQTLNLLTSIFKDQLLYFNILQRGDFTSGACYQGDMSSLLKNILSEEQISQTFSRVVRGDGRFTYNPFNPYCVPPFTGVTLYHDLLSERGFNVGFKPEIHQPVFLFPLLHVEYGPTTNDETNISYFTPLLKILNEEDWKLLENGSETIHCVDFDCEQHFTIHDIFNWRPKNKIGSVAKILTMILNQYRYNNRRSMKRVLRYESRLIRKLIQFLDIVKDAYIYSFHHITNLRNLGKLNDQDIYSQFVKFFLSCGVVDLGYLFLKHCCITPADMGLTIKDTMKLNNRVNSVNYLANASSFVGNKHKKAAVTFSEIHFLTILCAVVQSKYAHGFVLRSCLFQLHQGIPTTNDHHQKLSWNKETSDFEARLLHAIRSEILFRMPVL